MTTSEFKTKAREILDTTRRHADLRTEIDEKRLAGGGTIKLKAGTYLTIEQALSALTSLHHSELKQAEEAVLDRVEKEVINATKEIYMTNDLPNLLETEEYVKIRQELRAEQRQRLDALRQEGDKSNG